jgi:alkanesulfonate monooxygenase SsuD/methylene tetrahydromethanopterin reductase-like flavin-dependent oxidoreductase (luciferase family)
MKLDAALPPVPLADVPSIASAAEALGFDTLWTSETTHDPFLPHTLIAEHTTKLHSGTAIAVSFARSPATIAYTAWDLAAHSNGRFSLGLGTQVKAHVERRFGLEWPASVTGKLREQIQVIRALWDCWQNGIPLNQRGDYYKITLMPPFFNPGPIKLPSPGGTIAPEAKRSGGGAGGEGENPINSLIPIYIAGVNTGLASLAGELCDGFHVHPFHTPQYLNDVLLPAIAAGAEKAGRQKSAITISVTAFVATSAQEREAARRQIAFYASTPSYRPVMQLHGWQSAAEKLSSLAARGEWNDMPALVNDEMLATFAVLTDESDLSAALHKRYNGIADRITLYMPFKPGERDGFWKEFITSLLMK